MDQTIRNKLRSVVTQCRKLLEDAVAQTLQGQFGIYSGNKGEVHVEDAARMTHLSTEDQVYRKDILDHFEHIKARGGKPKEALDQLIREIAFTHLNRLCAYKLMEVRQVWIGGQRFREAVSRGQKSQGFMFYLADHPDDEHRFRTGQQDVAYRHFLDWLGGMLSEEIGVLFNPNDPAKRLYPPQRVLDEVLALINSEELAEIWTEDETIGWVYQYFTPKELRVEARKNKQPPRNSYELAFRNQFFTPRYVVELLTDNTLGRVWYEMQKGNTRLIDQCRYMVRRPTEIFLQEGQSAPKDTEESTNDLSQEEVLKEPVYILHRPKKDPRDLKILDPACGSGHFLLYCFDLLWTIYEEAYNDPDLGPTLKKDYSTIEDFRREVPGLILSRNLYGIDIDIRTSQIAALALWLRCQRAYQSTDLKKDRPKITRSNIVCAEPMPGEQGMLIEFVAELQPKVLGQLVEVVFDKMKLAGEAGSLLKIEKEIASAISEAKKQWLARPKAEQLTLWAEEKRIKAEQLGLFDVSGITDEEFWHDAETRVLDALYEYAQSATSGSGLQRKLFAEDATHGFVLIDLCRKRFDVVLMNPPFGEPTSAVKASKEIAFSKQPTDLYCWFVARAATLLQTNGLIGCITSSSFKTYLHYEAFRTAFISTQALCCYADLGWEVLDEAYVETCCYILFPAEMHYTYIPFFDLRTKNAKAASLLNSLYDLTSPDLYWRVPSDFHILDSSPIVYEWSRSVLRSLSEFPTFGSLCEEIGIGAGPHTFFYRLLWEVPPETIGLKKRWALFANGGPFSPFHREDSLLLEWEDSGRRIKQYLCERYPYLGGNTGWKIQLEHYYGRPGLTYGKKTTNFSAQILPEGSIFSFEGIGVFPRNEADIFWLLAYLNSSFSSWFLNITCGLHKNPVYLRRLPVPQFSLEDRNVLERCALLAWRLQFSKSTEHETASCFRYPTYALEALGCLRRRDSAVSTNLTLSDLLDQIDEIVWKYLPISRVDRNTTPKEIYEQSDDDDDRPEPIQDNVAEVTISYTWGCVFGRWDIRFATGEAQLLEPSDPLALHPVCSPGMLQDSDGLPFASPPQGYPLSINWDGILVDDPDHQDDIIRRIRHVLELAWKDQADAVERKACEILDIKELRDYFRKSSKGGFWDNHVSRYSKSRRKAPIYWLLQSSKKNYALWVYYHRLDKDILFKALLNYVEPKIRLEENHLEPLRAQRTGAGASGKGVKKLEKNIERQEEFIAELRDFEDKLRRVANLHLEPDLNDGVMLNIAPLWELVPWKEAKQYWEELLGGKYEWSSIGKQLREKGIVRDP